MKILSKAITIFFIFIIIAIAIALFVVSSDVPSNATNDGWLSFIGGIAGSAIAFFTSMYVLYISSSQTKKIEENNKKFQKFSIASTSYSNIDFRKDQYFFKDCNGKSFYKAKIYDTRNIPLKNIIIHSLYIQEEENGIFGEKISLIDKEIKVYLEYTPEQEERGDVYTDKDFYFAIIPLNKDIFEVFNHKHYRLETMFSVTNAFNISTKQDMYQLAKIKECTFKGDSGTDEYLMLLSYHDFCYYRDISFEEFDDVSK